MQYPMLQKKKHEKKKKTWLLKITIFYSIEIDNRRVTSQTEMSNEWSMKSNNQLKKNSNKLLNESRTLIIMLLRNSGNKILKSQFKILEMETSVSKILLTTSSINQIK